jgi:hypothetical protein
MKRRQKNSKGEIFYGMHMYPGVAEYRPPGSKPYRILVEETVIRTMGKTFPGRPVFALHVDEVDSDLDRLKNEADGWVVESFFNEADGKHWTKFIVCSKKAIRCIQNGYGLSNCYNIDSYGGAGVHNGLDYDRKLLKGEYEHLAIVPDPRYESKILTPEEFKRYNEQQKSELQKVANSKSHKEKTMGKKSSSALSFFKRDKVENSKNAELASMSVLLPKSNRERTILQCVEAADAAEMQRGRQRVANANDLVRIENEELRVEDIVDELVSLRERVEELESRVGGDDDEEVDEELEEEEDVIENEDDEDEDMDDDDVVENEDDDEEEDPKPKAKAKNSRRTGGSTKNSNRDQKTKKAKHQNSRRRNDNEDEGRGRSNRRMKNQNDRDPGGDDHTSKDAKERARRARNANSQDRNFDDVDTLDTAASQVSRGMERYG